jgi:peptidoglycan hydrolase CwlO-like protein
MKAMAVVAILAGVAAAAAGAYAWMQHQDLAQTKAALNGANSELQKTRSDLTATQAELVALRKEFSEQQMALNQLQAEMANARAFVEAEKAISARLRAELVKMKEQFATALRAGRGAPSRNTPAPPMLVREPQQPMVIRAVPGGASVQRANPAPAR